MGFSKSKQTKPGKYFPSSVNKMTAGIQWRERGRGSMIQLLPYDRRAAVAYAHKWAYGRNPAYYDFSEIGGD